MPDSAFVATDGTDRKRPPGRHTLKILLVPIVVLVVLNNVGDMIQPTLVDTHPLLLVAMNARNRNLILVTNHLDAWSYYIVATLRLLLSDPLFFLIGYWYGDTAIAWMESERRRTASRCARSRAGSGRPRTRWCSSLQTTSSACSPARRA